MAKNDEVYSRALEGKSIPILTLDNKWHQLFTQTEMTPEIEQLADELNALVERDGKIRTETKNIKKIKKKLLGEIMPLRDQANKSGALLLLRRKFRIEQGSLMSAMISLHPMRMSF